MRYGKLARSSLDFGRYLAELLIICCAFALAFWIIGTIIGLLIQRNTASPTPSATMTLAVVDTEQGLEITSVHLAKSLAEDAGINTITIFVVEYRTRKLPLVSWKFARQLERMPRSSSELHWDGAGWRATGQVHRLSSAAAKLAWDFERSPAASSSIRRCIAILDAQGSPALILRPLGWFVVIYTPLGFTACVLLTGRWFAQFIPNGRAVN